MAAGGAVFVLALGLAVQNPRVSDIEHDWLAVRAAVDGSGAHAPRSKLLERYSHPCPECDDASPFAHHPRTPGGLLVLAPLGAIPLQLVPALWAIISAGAVVGLVLVAAALAHVGSRGGMVLLLAMVTSFPVFHSFLWGSQSALVALLIACVPLLMIRRGPVVAGSLLGVAATLKLYPLLLAPLLVRHPRALAGAGGTFLVLNALGLTLPGVSVAGSLSTLTSAPGGWFHLSPNGSVASFLWRYAGWDPWVAMYVGAALGVIGLTALGLAAWRESRWVPAYFAGLAIVLLAVPNSWAHYDLALYPAAFILIAALPVRFLWGFLAAFTLVLGWGWVFVWGADLGPASLFSRVSVLAAMVWVAVVSDDRARSSEGVAPRPQDLRTPAVPTTTGPS